MSMELIIKKPEGGYARKVEWNFQELKKELTDSVFKYKDLTYTKEQILDAKKDLAGLRKFTKAISDRRISIKKEFLESYEVFNGEVKELNAISAPIIQDIDKQIKDFEEKRKQDKRKVLETYYNENVGDLSNILSFGLIFQAVWLNSSFTPGNAQGKIFEIIARTKNDLLVINELESKFTNQLLDFYSGIGKLDLSKTLQENSRLKEKQQKIDEYNQKKADEKKAREALCKTEVLKQQEVEKTQAKVTEVCQESTATLKAEVSINIKPKSFKLLFGATGTLQQFRELRTFCDSTGIIIQQLKG